jgi:hypothetical protein
MCANFMGPSQGLLGNKKLQGRMTTTSRKRLHGEQGWCAHRKIFKIKVRRVMMRMVILASLVFYNNRFVKEKQVKNSCASPFASPPQPPSPEILERGEQTKRFVHHVHLSGSPRQYSGEGPGVRRRGKGSSK